MKTLPLTDIKMSTLLVFHCNRCHSSFSIYKTCTERINILIVLTSSKHFVFITSTFKIVLTGILKIY